MALSEENKIQKQALANDNNDYEIDLLELAFCLLENVKIIITCALILAILSGLYTTYMITPMYSSTAKLYVLNQSDSAIKLADLQIGTALAKDYQEVFKNWNVHHQVKENLGLSFSEASLAGMIRISNPADTRILYLTITCPDAILSQQIVNEYARVAREFIAATMDTAQPNVFEEGRIPTRPSSPSLTRNILYGFIIGTLLSAAFFIIRFLMDDRIKSSEDIEKWAGLATLGMMPVAGNQEEAKHEHNKKKGHRK